MCIHTKGNSVQKKEIESQKKEINLLRRTAEYIEVLEKGRESDKKQIPNFKADRRDLAAQTKKEKDESCLVIGKVMGDTEITTEEAHALVLTVK